MLLSATLLSVVVNYKSATIAVAASNVSATCLVEAVPTSVTAECMP